MARKCLMVVFLILALAVVGACGGKPTPKPVATPAPKSTTEARAISGRSVTASGIIVPVQKAELAFTLAGRIRTIVVAVGDQVQAGQVLVQLDDAALTAQLAQAEANLAAAQARLSELKRMPTIEDLGAAQQNMVSAQAAYDSLLHPTENELLALKSDCDKTRALLSQAQAAYDRTGGDANLFAGMTPERAQLQIAWLDNLKAESLYNQRIKPTNAEIRQALASVQNAQSQLAKLQPSAEDLATAQSTVNAAQAARDFAADQLKNAKLVAPFAATVASLNADPNEVVLPGQAVLAVANLGTLQVETTDLSERDVSRVAVGQSVTIRVKPLDVQISGMVTCISPRAGKVGGDVVYTVLVDLKERAQGLAWGMTVDVEIEGTSAARIESERRTLE